MGRMANEDEYQGVIQFLCSDPSRIYEWSKYCNGWWQIHLVMNQSYNSFI